MVMIRLLGPVDFVDGAGNVRAPASALRRSMLALLALRPGEVASANWLLEHAWNGRPPDSGLRALRFHISQLRKELGDPALIDTTPGGYRLAVSADQVDALIVECAATRVRLESDPVRAEHILSEALAQWRGSPFT